MVCTETQWCSKCVKHCHLQIPTCCFCFRKQYPWLQSGCCPGWCLTLNPNQIVIVQTLSGSHAVEGKAQQLSSYLLGSPVKDFPEGIFSLLCSQTFGVRFRVAIPLALPAAVGSSTVMSRLQDVKDWDMGMKLCEIKRLGFPFCFCCQYLVNANLAVSRLQHWSCKCFASN